MQMSPTLWWLCSLTFYNVNALILCRLFLASIQINQVLEKMNLSRQDFRAIIYFNFKSSRSVKETHELMRQAFGDETPALATIYNWYAEFQRGRA